MSPVISQQPLSTAISRDKLSPTKKGLATAPKAFTRSHRVNTWIRLANFGSPKIQCRVPGRIKCRWRGPGIVQWHPTIFGPNTMATWVVRTPQCRITYLRNQETAHWVFPEPVQERRLVRRPWMLAPEIQPLSPGSRATPGTKNKHATSRIASLLLPYPCTCARTRSQYAMKYEVAVWLSHFSHGSLALLNRLRDPVRVPVVAQHDFKLP